jgi:hypothetical protein
VAALLRSLPKGTVLLTSQADSATQHLFDTVGPPQRALTPPDPQLKGAWYPAGFNPCTYQVKTRFQNSPFKCDVHRYDVVDLVFKAGGASGVAPAGGAYDGGRGGRRGGGS